MKTALIVAAAALALSGCYRNETAKEAVALSYSDTPAQVTCTGYNGLMIDTVSKGTVIYDEGGRVTFTDAKTGHMVKTEGECIVRYSR